MPVAPRVADPALVTKTNRDSLQGLLFLVGVYEGLAPFVCKPLGWHPFLAIPVRLDAPWWWIVAGAVVLVVVGAMWALDRVEVSPDGR